jgi:hypothetical protein
MFSSKVPSTNSPWGGSTTYRRRIPRQSRKPFSGKVKLLRSCVLGTSFLAGAHAYSTHGSKNRIARAFWPQKNAGQVPTTSPFESRAKISHRESAVLRMVLTTPEAIIEQASTRKLLDVLIDESVRTSARKPIMMQFDPSSGWVSGT